MVPLEAMRHPHVRRAKLLIPCQQDGVARAAGPLLAHLSSVTLTQTNRCFRAASLRLSVSYGLTEVPRDSCFLRSRPHLALIEETMSQLVRWGLTTTIAGPSDGPGGAALEGETATPATSAGFGAVGTGGGTPARKGAPAKKKKSKKK